MNNFINFLQTKVTPRLNKVNNNIWVLTIKDSMLQVLPFIFLGSIFSILSITNNYFPGLPNFNIPFGWTMGKISIFVAFLIPFNLMEKSKLRKMRFIAGMTGIILFFMTISPQLMKEGIVGFNHSSFGAGGMFIAIVTSIVVGLVMTWFGKFSFFKEESVFPDFIKAWFDAMLPIGIIVIFGWITVYILKFDLYNSILLVFNPLSGIVESPLGFVVVMFLYCFLYSMGISAWVLGPVVQPVLLNAIAQNIEFMSSGSATIETLNLVTKTTVFSTYLWIGGVGCTLPLALMILKAKSKKLKALGKASLVPSIFNINEPLVFGAISWNPIMMIPMWLQGIVLPIIIYLFTKVIPLSPIPTIQFDMWYCPYPISTWLSTQSFTAFILLAIVFVISGLIWYPFFKMNDRQELAKEEEQQ